MPRYRVHRMKEGPSETFRWAPHTGGLAAVRLKDYDASDEIDAGNTYQAWQLAMQAGRPLRPGDLLESLSDEADRTETAGRLFIAKYIGFEPAQWVVPEPKAVASGAAPDTLSSAPTVAEVSAS